MMQPTIRLNHYLAQAGVFSRRQADVAIEARRVLVDGKVAKMGLKVSLHATVKVDGETILLEPNNQIVVLLNKPIGFLSTTSDPHGRPTVIDLLHRKNQKVRSPSLKKNRLYPVGRLDKDTTGVLLLTNDGALCYKLTHPSRKVSKVYQLKLMYSMERESFLKLRQGIRLEDGFIKPDALQFVENSKGTKLKITLHSGKKRVIRRLLASLGYEIIHLERISLGNITTRGLKQGQWRYLTSEEILLLQKKH